MAQPSTVLITGAASGIGRALAHHYAPRASLLLLLDRDAPGATALELASAPSEIRTAAVDVRDAAATSEAVAQLADGTPIDLVVNCAGVLPPIDPLPQVRPEDFQRTIDVNLTGSFNVVHAVLPHLRAGSSLALIASLAGLIAGYRYTAYSASKFGVVGLAEAIRMELRQQGISTHVICPGEVSTPMVADEIAAGDSVQRSVKLLSGKPITPEAAAAGIAAGIEKGSFFVIPTAQARWLSRISRFSAVPMRQGLADLSVKLAARRA